MYIVIYIYSTIVIYDVIYEKHWESKNVFVTFSNILMMPRTGSETEGQLSRPTGDAVRADKLHPHLLPSPSWPQERAVKPPLPRLKVGNLLKLPQMLYIYIIYRDDLQILSAGPPLYCISHLLLVSYIPLHSHRIPVTSKGPTAGCNSCRVARTVRACKHVCMSACMDAWMHGCMDVWICVCVCILYL